MLDPNPEGPKDDEDGDSDTTITADELPGGHLIIGRKVA